MFIDESTLSGNLLTLLNFFDLIVAADLLSCPRRIEAEALGAVCGASMERVSNAARLLRVNVQGAQVRWQSLEAVRLLIRSHAASALRNVAIVLVVLYSLRHIVWQRKPLLRLAYLSCIAHHVRIRIVLVRWAAEPIRIRRLFAALLHHALLVQLQLPHPLVQRLVQLLVVLLDLFLELVDPLFRNVGDELARMSAAGPSVPALLVEVDAFDAALSAPRLQLFLKMLQF